VSRSIGNLRIIKNPESPSIRETGIATQYSALDSPEPSAEAGPITNPKKMAAATVTAPIPAANATTFIPDSFTPHLLALRLDLEN
jgi:hypothetical protein